MKYIIHYSSIILIILSFLIFIGCDEIEESNAIEITLIEANLLSAGEISVVFFVTDPDGIISEVEIKQSVENSDYTISSDKNSMEVSSSNPSATVSKSGEDSYIAIVTASLVIKENGESINDLSEISGNFEIDVTGSLNEVSYQFSDKLNYEAAESDKPSEAIEYSGPAEETQYSSPIVEVDPVDNSANYTSDAALYEKLCGGEPLANLTSELAASTVMKYYDLSQVTSIQCRYVKPFGSTYNDGTSWDNAWDTSALLNPELNANITDASADNIYILLIKEGTYRIESKSSYFKPKSYISYIGGFSGVGFEEGNETILSGDVNGDDTDGFDSPTRSDNGMVVYFISASNLLFANLTVSGGYNTNQGGGLGILYSTNLKFINLTIQGNHSINAGGGFALRGGSSLKVITSVISDNYAGWTGGGGIYISGGNSLDIISSTISNNITDYGASNFHVYNINQPFNIVNSIIWGTENSIDVTAATGTQIRFVNNILQGGSANAFNVTNPENFDFDEIGTITDDPNLPATGTLTWEPQAGSSAIDAGTYVGIDADDQLCFDSDPADGVMIWKRAGSADLASPMDCTLPVLEITTDKTYLQHIGQPDIGAFEAK